MIFIGEGRVNEQPTLAAMHTLFHRLHNHFVDQLFRVNPHLNAESLFQHARRLVRAVTQSITYNEWGKVVLGETVFKAFQLGPDQGEYDPNIATNLDNEFAAFGYRLGHTYIAGDLPYSKIDFSRTELIQLRDVRPGIAHRTFVYM